MIPKLNGHEKIFLMCPKYGEHVEAITVCVDCDYFQGFTCPQIQKVQKRKDLGEVTEQYLGDAIEEYRGNPKLWYIVCTHPVCRQCNVMKLKGGEDCGNGC